MEGAIFQGDHMNQKLLSDLDLGVSDDLKSDLRGRFEVAEAKNAIFCNFSNCTTLIVSHDI